MDYKNFFKWLEDYYRIDIDKELQNTLSEHFGANLNIYTEQDLYEKKKKIIQIYKDKNITKYKKYWFDN